MIQSEGMINDTYIHGCMETRVALKRSFPDDADDLMRMIEARSVSDIPITGMGVEDPVGVLSRAGGDRRAMRELSGSLCEGAVLAMEYLGPYGECPGYLETGTDLRYDYRPRANIFLLADANGTPVGMVPLGCSRMESWKAYGKLRDRHFLVITDRIPYSEENVTGLEKSVDDYLLVQWPFPISYSSTRNAQMQELSHNGRTLRTCKIRYDKRWLFRFTDPAEAEMVRGRIPDMDVDRRELDVLRLSAGSTDVISNVGHDIREVRRMLDIRQSMDIEMRRHRRLLAQDSALLVSEDAVMGYMLMSVLSTRQSMTGAP